MITPRTTRLLRTPGLRALQRTVALAAHGTPHDVRDTLIVVSSAGAVDQLRRTLEELWLVERWVPADDECAAIGVAEGACTGAAACVWPAIVTRAGMYRGLYERLDDPPALLDDYAREVLFQGAAAEAIARGDAPPFEVRPGLVPEMLSLYDALRRQHRRIDDFERLVGGALEAGAEIDRGAQRLLQQTRFLVSAFRAYEARLTEAESLDEHGLRAKLLERSSARPIRRAIVTVPDQRADAAGLWPADFDLLTRIAGLEAIDIVATEALLAAGYLERLFETLPGIDVRVVPDVEGASPLLLAPPPDGRQDPWHFTSRDREQELADVVRRLSGVADGAEGDAAGRNVADGGAAGDVTNGGVVRGHAAGGDVAAAGRAGVASYEQMAVVYQRPLPYLYLARQVFGAHGVPWQAFDALPLAAEPYAAALDLVITFALSDYTRGAGIALLRAPQFRFEVDGRAPTWAEIAACDAELREAGYLGGRDRLHALLDAWRVSEDESGGGAAPSRGAHTTGRGDGQHLVARRATDVSGGDAARPRGAQATGGDDGRRFDARRATDEDGGGSAPPRAAQATAYGDGRPRVGSAWSRALAVRALASLVAAADALDALAQPALPSVHLAAIEQFLDRFERPAAIDDGIVLGRASGGAVGEAGIEPLVSRHLRARAAVIGTIAGLRHAFTTHGEREGPFRDLAALLHRWLEGQTFNPRVGERGLHLLDVQAAVYGRFTHVALVGVVESEWPAASSRSIFYPASLLRDLGWPAEPERRAAARAVFDDLLRLARDEVSVSVFALEHDAIVRPSPFVEDLAGAGLRPRRVVEDALEVDAGARTAVRGAADPHGRLFTVPALTLLPDEVDAWAALRQARSPIAGREFHGWTGAIEPRAYSVTGLDRYLQCPFKYFAAHVLRLDEEPDRRPGLTPLERGRFEHEVFQQFFSRWESAGHGAIDESSLDTARAEFAAVVDEVVARLPSSERALERTRLLGSAVSAGLGERVFRFEAARLAPIAERLLEYSLDGEYVLTVPVEDESAESGRAEGSPPETRTRSVRLRGTADRMDLLSDGTVRVIDYKTGKASSASSSIQLPVYAHCAEQRLDAYRGRRWRVSEAGYLAFGRPEPFVPVVAAGDDARKKVTEAVARVVDVVDRIEEGAFPVTPVEPHMCMFCGYSAVCRKDYVEDL